MIPASLVIGSAVVVDVIGPSLRISPVATVGRQEGRLKQLSSGLKQSKRHKGKKPAENEVWWDGGIKDSQCLHFIFTNNLNCSSRASRARTIPQLYVKLFDTDCVFKAKEGKKQKTSGQRKEQF